jgi:hypothetical protein
MVRAAVRVTTNRRAGAFHRRPIASRPSVGLAQQGDRPLVAEPFHDRRPGAAIGGPIVHDNELVGLQVLSEDAANRLLDKAGAVVERDDGND